MYKVQYQQLIPRRPWMTIDGDIPATDNRFELHRLTAGLSDLLLCVLCLKGFIFSLP